MNKNIQCEHKKEKIIVCVLTDDKGEDSLGIYYPDDGGERLIFSKNVNDLEYLEDFSGHTEKEIEKHLNIYGFEVEPTEAYGDVLEYKSLPETFKISLVEAELIYSISAKLKL